MTDWVDGEALVRWMREQRLVDNPAVKIGKSDTGTMSRWKQGAKANVYTVDRVLCNLGRCLGELPDDLYTEPPIGGGVRKEALPA